MQAIFMQKQKYAVFCLYELGISKFYHSLHCVGFFPYGFPSFLCDMQPKDIAEGQNGGYHGRVEIE